MPIYDSVVDTIGGTPLIRLRSLSQGLDATILAKMESRNPCGSVKDRIGVEMIRTAETEGRLKPGATIVEATSGNTGIALAFAAAALGYKLIIAMPETMSRERVGLLRLFGAEVILTRGGFMRDAVAKAKEIAAETPGAVLLKQFDNPANPEAHRKTTAQEILADTEGNIAAFVAGVGTGGTITGVGEVLKQSVPDIRVVAVEQRNRRFYPGSRRGHTIYRVLVLVLYRRFSIGMSLTRSSQSPRKAHLSTRAAFHTKRGSLLGSRRARLLLRRCSWPNAKKCRGRTSLLFSRYRRTVHFYGTA